MANDAIQRARRFEAAGEIDQALAAYREVTPDQPEYEQARIRVVGIALMRGQMEEAEREAREFIGIKPDRPESHATLGQVLRLTSRHDDAIATFKKASELAPQLAGYRTFLNDARRARYWSPDVDLYRGLLAHVSEGKADAASEYRLLHLRLLRLMAPKLQRWLLADNGAADLPDSLRQALDADTGGRFSEELAELAAMRRRPPSRARVSFADGASREGALEDGDGTIGAALEAIDRDEYALLPFAEINQIDFVEKGAYVGTKVTPRSGKVRKVEVPSLYFFTEGSRSQDLRSGRRTAWRKLAEGLQIGLGQRTFQLDGEHFPLDRVARIDFL